MKGVLSPADATVVVAIISAIGAPLVAAWVATRKGAQRAERLRAEFDRVRAENSDQHAAGQQLLRTLVDSHHHLGDKVDGLATKLDGHISDHAARIDPGIRTRKDDHAS